MKLNKRFLIGIAFVFLTSCSLLVPPTKAFKDMMDSYYVGQRKSLSEFTQVYSPPSMEVQMTREVKPGVIEYFFEWGKGFYKPGKECKFVLVVEKDTEKIIGWRYNGNPDYCWII